MPPTGDAEALESSKRKAEEKINGLKQDVENLELALNKAETEKQTKDNQIRTLNEEMARQDEAVSFTVVIILYFHIVADFCNIVDIETICLC